MSNMHYIVELQAIPMEGSEMRAVWIVNVLPHLPETINLGGHFYPAFLYYLCLTHTMSTTSYLIPFKEQDVGLIK